MGNSSAKKKKEAPPANNKNFYSFSRVIGKGGFGKVWKVYDKRNKRPYAMKIIDKARVITKKSVQSIMNQKEILSYLANEESNFLVNLHSAFQDRENCYLLIDYLQGGDLRNYLNRNVSFNEDQIRFLMRCIIEGLNHLHRRSIIHRDIKPQNIILDKYGYARITDLGIAKFWRTENSNETSGTPGYMAPEVLLRQNHSFCADLYAVGIIAFELFARERPYKGKDRKSIREEMLSKEAKLPPTVTCRMSEEAIDFVHRLVQRSPKKRLGYAGTSEVLRHPWLYKSNEEHQQFLEKTMSSPIQPIEVSFNKALQQDTEPDEVWRQNILLLKKQDIQDLFKGYEFNERYYLSVDSIKGSTITADSITEISALG